MEGDSDQFGTRDALVAAVVAAVVAPVVAAVVAAVLQVTGFHIVSAQDKKLMSDLTFAA